MGSKVKNEFPKIMSGSCDGLGCGRDVVPCWCDELADSCNTFQQKFDRQWLQSYDGGKENGSYIWESAFRYTFKRFEEYNKKVEGNYKRDADYATRVIGDNNESISVLCDLVEQQEERMDELEYMLGVEMTIACLAEIKLEEAEETIDELKRKNKELNDMLDHSARPF